MRHQCPWCFATTDFIERKSTKCTDCADAATRDKGQWDHIQTLEGNLSIRRAREGAALMREQTRMDLK